MPCGEVYDTLNSQLMVLMSGHRLILVLPLITQVQRQVHSSLSAKGDALEYIEGLILQLLGMLCASQPHTWTDVEHRVGATFPSAIQTWAHNDAKRALEKGKKRSTLVLPVDKIHALLVKVCRTFTLFWLF